MTIVTEQTQDIAELQELEELEETVEIQEIEMSNLTEDETPSVLRTRRDGVWEVYKGAWGSYLRPTDDPDANVVIDEDGLNAFELNPNIHKIPAELWTRWVNLCFHYVDKVQSSVEVSIRILRSEEDPSQYRMLVPRQKVSGASVRVDTFDEAIDIETGEEITQYPPAGWIPVGSSHSHNTMQAFFSGIDDQYELGDPGIHLVVGSINIQDRKYTIAASVVGSGRRFKVPFNDLIDATPINNIKFHPKVIDYVDYTYTATPGASSLVHTKKWTKKVSGDDTSSYQEWLRQSYGSNFDYMDPYSYSEGYYSHYQCGERSYGSTREVKLWEIEDLMNDFIHQHQDDFAKLCDLHSMLDKFRGDIDNGILMKMDEVAF